MEKTVQDLETEIRILKAEKTELMWKLNDAVVINRKDAEEIERLKADNENYQTVIKAYQLKVRSMYSPEAVSKMLYANSPEELLSIIKAQKEGKKG